MAYQISDGGLRNLKRPWFALTGGSSKNSPSRRPERRGKSKVRGLNQFVSTGGAKIGYFPAGQASINLAVTNANLATSSLKRSRMEGNRTDHSASGPRTSAAARSGYFGRVCLLASRKMQH
jgi:hypothetical protein